MAEYQYTQEQMARIEALNIASREAVARGSDKSTIENAREMVAFILEGK